MAETIILVLEIQLSLLHSIPRIQPDFDLDEAAYSSRGLIDMATCEAQVSRVKLWIGSIRVGRVSAAAASSPIVSQSNLLLPGRLASSLYGMASNRTADVSIRLTHRMLMCICTCVCKPHAAAVDKSRSKGTEGTG